MKTQAALLFQVTLAAKRVVFFFSSRVLALSSLGLMITAPWAVEAGCEWHAS